MPPKHPSDDRGGRQADAAGGGNEAEQRAVYFEFFPVGDSIKVSAVDSETGTEVSITGPVRAPRSELERIALNKLRYVMKQARDKDQPAGVDKPISGDGKGWVV
ncbi:MAG: hypothetical protein RLO08_11750 [Parvibaculaceae bacterium]